MLECHDRYIGILHSVAEREKHSIHVLFENEIMISSISHDLLYRIGDEYINASIAKSFFPYFSESYQILSAAMSSVAEDKGYSIGGNYVDVPYENEITRVRINHSEFRHIVGFLINPVNPRIERIKNYIKAVRSVKL